MNTIETIYAQGDSVLGATILINANSNPAVAVVTALYENQSTGKTIRVRLLPEQCSEKRVPVRLMAPALMDVELSAGIKAKLIEKIECQPIILQSIFENRIYPATQDLYARDCGFFSVSEMVETTIEDRIKNHVLVAADTVENLRRPDVMRVLDSAFEISDGFAVRVAKYICQYRKDLEQECSACMDELNGELMVLAG